jgi:hypothetical protein
MRLRLAREAALVLAHTGADAADDLLNRAACGERRSGLGKGHALLSHHAPRLGRGGRPAARELQHAQGHHRLHLEAKPRGIEGELHPGREHGYRIRGVGGGECKGTLSECRATFAGDVNNSPTLDCARRMLLLSRVGLDLIMNVRSDDEARESPRQKLSKR